MGSVLVFSGFGVPEFSSRAATQTLQPIQQAGQLKRTVNGGLLDLSAPQFRKYHSNISCNDQQPPAVDGVWQGQVVQVDCISLLSYKIGGTPQRTIVPGSSYEESGYVFYRPRLIMRVMDFNISRDEYGAVISWSMELEEI